MDKEKSPRIKKSTPIDPRKFKAFVKFLPDSIKTLAETYKFACEVYSQIGLIYYWEELFVLPASVVFKSENGPCRVCFDRSSCYATRGESFFSHYLEDDLAEKLLVLSRSNEGGLLFQQKDGGSFDIDRLGKEFRRASQKALKAGAIKTAITPIHLRTTPSLPIRFQSGTSREVSKKKIQEIMNILPNNSRNAGRHREKPLKAILEALLAQENFEYSRNEMMRLFPVGLAAESQKRRWKEKGIWPQILRILQS